jgi:hypothetical protein
VVGAVGGAMVGAVVGALVGAVVGTGVGVLAGAGVIVWIGIEIGFGASAAARVDALVVMRGWVNMRKAGGSMGGVISRLICVGEVGASEGSVFVFLSWCSDEFSLDDLGKGASLIVIGVKDLLDFKGVEGDNGGDGDVGLDVSIMPAVEVLGGSDEVGICCTFFVFKSSEEVVEQSEVSAIGFGCEREEKGRKACIFATGGNFTLFCCGDTSFSCRSLFSFVTIKNKEEKKLYEKVSRIIILRCLVAWSLRVACCVSRVCVLSLRSCVVGDVVHVIKYHLVFKRYTHEIQF